MCTRHLLYTNRHRRIKNPRSMKFLHPPHSSASVANRFDREVALTTNELGVASEGHGYGVGEPLGHCAKPEWPVVSSYLRRRFHLSGPSKIKNDSSFTHHHTTEFT